MYPTDPELPIFFPQDELESHRLDHQHLALRMCLGHNYFGPLTQHLRHDPQGVRKRVLDVGTGQGSWVQEMATEFPDAEFISLDVSPMAAHIPRENITFEVYDLYAGLAEPASSFDVVHMRHMAFKVPNYPALIRELHRVLKPGGLLLLGELENEAYGAADPDTPLGDAVPRLSRGLRLLREALAAQGVMHDAGRRIPNILADADLFKPGSSSSYVFGTSSDSESSSGKSFSSIASSSASYSYFDAPVSSSVTSVSSASGSSSSPPGFVDITFRTYPVPATPWPNYLSSPALHESGRQSMFAMRRGWPSLVPLLTTCVGLSADDAHEVAHGALADYFVNPSLRLVTNYHTTWAIKA
ncbi:methyltransferase domain protein [Ceratobasidium sp. AG-Ba]|nr:methyltransferase domain protein [Ceratobasidium sp. AG-Ba]